LIVDDHAGLREILRVVYTGAGYTVVTAAHGREALDHLATSLVDVIVTDVHMPVMSGVELCRAVYADPRTRTIPLIVLSMTDYAAVLFDVPLAAVQGRVGPARRGLIYERFTARRAVVLYRRGDPGHQRHERGCEEDRHGSEGAGALWLGQLVAGENVALDCANMRSATAAGSGATRQSSYAGGA
jgi:CheY-like chemotaxis protein